MSYIFEQKFYRTRTGGRRKVRQDKTVQVKIEDPKMHPQERKKLAREALYGLPNTGFLSGWTPWMLGKSRVIPEEEAAPVVEVEQPPKQPDPAYIHSHTPAPEPEVVEEEVAPEPVVEPETKPKKALPHIRGGAIMDLKPFSRYKIKNVYDKPEFPVDAVKILQPDFEYPDWEDERVSQLWRR